MNQQQLIKETLSVEKFNELILDSIQDIKGKKIVKLDLRGLEATPTDFFIICEEILLIGKQVPSFDHTKSLINKKQ